MKLNCTAMDKVSKPLGYSTQSPDLIVSKDSLILRKEGKGKALYTYQFFSLEYKQGPSWESERKTHACWCLVFLLFRYIYVVDCGVSDHWFLRLIRLSILKVFCRTENYTSKKTIFSYYSFRRASILFFFKFSFSLWRSLVFSVVYFLFVWLISSIYA